MESIVLAITEEYAKGLFMKDLLPWHDLGYSFLIEYLGISGFKLFQAIKPHICILDDNLNGVSLDDFKNIASWDCCYIMLSSKKSNDGLTLDKDNLSKDDMLAALEKCSSINAESAKNTNMIDSRIKSSLTEIESEYKITQSRDISSRFSAAVINIDALDKKLFYNTLLVLNSQGGPVRRAEDICELLNLHKKNINSGVAFDFEGRIFIVWPQYDDQPLFNTLAMCHDVIQRVSDTIKKELGSEPAFFLGSRVPGKALLKEYESLLEFSRVRYFCRESAVISADIISEAKKDISLQEIDNIENDIMQYILLHDHIHTLQSIEHLYSLIKSSMDFVLLKTVRDRLRIIYDSVLDIYSLPPMKIDFEDNFTCIEKEMEYASIIARNVIEHISEKSGVFSSIVVDAVAIISKCYMNNISTDSVADSLGISRTYLSRKFKETMGIGFNKYLNNTRINKAKEMLLSENESINNISAAVGYTDTKYFCKLFKNTIGCSPSEFRKMFGIRR